MTSKMAMGAAFAAGCALAVGAMPAKAQMPPQAYAGPMQIDTRVEMNAPQASRGDFGDWSARRNNMESAQYERLLQTNPGFRQTRMRKECGPITDPQLRDSCMASFGQHGSMMTGSSSAPRQSRLPRGAGY